MALEKRVEAVVLVHFGFPAELSPEVKRADLLLLATEQRDLFGKAVAVGMALPQRIAPLPAWGARREFLARFMDLSADHGAKVLLA
ncbi:MAG: hypothetical protein A2286_04130 [Gammaproteobacteria bacterium RIFOXYA12_FULL_61_12]|nr:MAG: hypothetical protein A2514_14585 [Gammaproteobacteria bacterium RIFOXYD12_FULL_61_37]OGT93454.1 MAG: hypothetical protein A2286_04130 [Gammaproteobacteria bacterium RIFOXYA12_FULL_61_12]